MNEAITGHVINRDWELRDPDRFFTIDHRFQENEFPKGKLVGEIFRGIAIEENRGTRHWWRLPGLWELHGPGY